MRDPKALPAIGKRLLRNPPTGPAARAFERAQDKLTRALFELKLAAKSVPDWERRLAHHRRLAGATLRKLRKALGLPRAAAGSDAELARALRSLGARAAAPRPLRDQARRRAKDLATCTRVLADARQQLARRQADVEARAAAWLQALRTLAGKPK